MPLPDEGSPVGGGRLSRVDRGILLEIARRSIDEGLHGRGPLSPDERKFPPQLRVPRATFTTLRIKGALRGCVGTTEAVRSLVASVADSAYAAAFRDSRFPRLAGTEMQGLDIHISVLSPLEPLDCASEEELVAALRPGIDGLTIREAGRGASYLPAVWESLPEARRFVRELKLKAGMGEDHWSDSLRVWRFSAEEFG